MKIASGTYTGNGIDNRSIPMTGDITADFIIIKGTAFIRDPQFWVRSMGVDQTKPDGGVLYAGGIKSVALNEMVLGTDARVNDAGESYVWEAFQATGQGDMLFLQYTGDGTDNRIIEFGTVPDVAFVFGEDTSPVVWGNRLHPAEGADPSNLLSQTLSGPPQDNKIQDFDACGIEIGSSSQVNANGVDYHVVVFKEVPGVLKVVSWTGDNAVSQAITGVGFEPYTVFAHSTRADAIRPMLMRPPDTTDVNSWRLDTFGGFNPPAQGILTLDADGFTVGNHAWVNEGGVYFTGFAAANNDAGASPDSLGVATVTQVVVEVVQTFEVTPNPPGPPELPCISPEFVNVGACPDLPEASRPVANTRLGFISMPLCGQLPSSSHPAPRVC